MAGALTSYFAVSSRAVSLADPSSEVWSCQPCSQLPHTNDIYLFPRLGTWRELII